METTYTTSTRTRTDRYGGYSPYGNRRFSEVQDDEEYSVPVQTSLLDDEDDTPEYEVEKNYLYSSDNDVVREENVRKMAMPDVYRKAKVVEEIIPEQRVKIRARGKIAIAVYSIIILSLIAFAIYNAVAINQMQALVATKNQTYITQSEVINDLMREYNNLGSDETIRDKVAGEFIVPSENDIVRVSKSSMETRRETVVESNWFEELCSFLSGLFN